MLVDLRAAARGGDRSALQLALAEMRMLAHSPRYWDKYLALLRHPLARLVDLLVIKQGERIVELRRWKTPKPRLAEDAKRPAVPVRESPPGTRRGRPTVAHQQPSLFDPV